jgi:CHAD domain-containing protein
VGEVALDETEILVGEGEEPVRLSRVEVEAGAGEVDSALETLRAFVAEMGQALGLKPTRLSKYAAGLFAVGQSPEAATDLGPTRVDDSVTLGELAFAVLRRQFGTMRVHEPGVRVGEDPEELHDMRVATRRMRAAIKLFKKALPERASHLRDEMKWVATVLGDVRDLDVQLERLEEWFAQADDDGYRDTLRRTSRLLEKQRKEARGRMLEALDSARYERFERSFAEMLKLGPTPSLTPGAAADEDSPTDEPAAVAGRGLLRRRYRKWRKLADAIDDASAPEEYHELRKEGKRLRYALEFFAEVYGEDVIGRLVKPLKVFQDDLGLHQDDLVAAEWLREMVTDSRRFPSKAAFFVGVLVGDLLREAAGIRERMRENEAFLVVADGKEWKKFQKTISKKPGKKS